MDTLPSNTASKAMQLLPPEILHLIISHLPKSSLPSIRLLNHTFEAIAFPLLFKNVLNWLDYKTSHAAILALAHDANARPSVMWSPWASEPDGEVESVWLGIVWRLQMRTGFGFALGGIGGGFGKSDEGGEGGKWEVLTPENYARLSGREDMSERRLRVAQNRYLMHRNYSNGMVKEGAVLGEVLESRVVWQEKES